MLIGERLKFIRQSVGSTQAVFAKECEVSPRAYAAYELGERDLPVQAVVRICEKFNVSANWLLLGKGAMRTTTLAATIVKAKRYAQAFIENDGGIYDEERRAVIEAKFQQHLLDHGDEGEAALKLFMEGKLDE
ncbi:helix-turn-helix transcriptional regulator [Ahrensia kielensis]|uniref:Helix-turn-helix transcriptional regulator n=1 Tax=Ahrensia kielensis TaxID=76980 RepID=A0ABU9T6U2_9HYPH